MDRNVNMKIIAHVRSELPEKFGIPRQSGLVDGLVSYVVFEPQYRDAEALRGIDGFSHLWLLWYFSETAREGWRATVRPPRLGGNTRMGVFATRAPYRPNPIGLSSVRLLGVEKNAENGTFLVIGGADLMDGTPVFDIKPYLAYTDSHSDATGGFADPVREHSLRVVISEELVTRIPEAKRASLVELLENDPRPGYQNAPEREYKMSFAGMTVAFKVEGETLTVTDIG